MKSFIYKFGLQQQYNDLRIKDGQTMYIITDTHKIYIGDQLYISGEASSPTNPSNIDLSNYATKNYVTTAISNIQIPNPDLSDYTTHEEMAQAIEAIQFPEPDLTGYATEQYVGNAIDAIPPVDFTGYATQQYVNNALFLPQLSSISDENNNKIAIFSNGGATISASNKTVSEITSEVAQNTSDISTINTVGLPNKISKKDPAPIGMLAEFTSQGDIESSSIAATDVNSILTTMNYLMVLTQTEYNELNYKAANHIYFISDTNKIYIGENELNSFNFGSSNNYSEATQSTAGLMSAADKTKLDSIPNNAVYTDTTYAKATSSTDGLMSKQQFNKLENQVLTVTNLTICTENTYNALSQKTATLYLVLIGNTGNQTFQFMDNVGNIINLANSTSSAVSSNVLSWTSSLSEQPENIITYTNEQTEEEWNT